MAVEWAEFDGFDWDAGNKEKNLKHRVCAGECEQVFFNEPLIILEDAVHSVAEDRFAAFGRTDSGRKLLIIYTLRGTKIRIISARDMSKRERGFYEEKGK